MSDLPVFKTTFLDLALKRQALQFGQFTLKSGRVSPYFFNMGILQRGSDLLVLGQCYAAAIEHYDLNADVIFGPAYKGVPIASVTVSALYQHYQRDSALAYNRKEAKQHGEGGIIVGQVADKKVLMVDDVITAGTAARQALVQLKAFNASVSALLVALDRQEKGPNNLSAIKALENDHQVNVYSLINLEDLLHYFSADSDQVRHQALQEYRAAYGI